MVESDFGGISLDFNIFSLYLYFVFFGGSINFQLTFESKPEKINSGEIQIKESCCQQLWCAMILTTENSNMSDNFTVSVVQVYFIERSSLSKSSYEIKEEVQFIFKCLLNQNTWK